jgi:phosphatidylglycerol:prolipoprotein diacylglycerol transferase
MITKVPNIPRGADIAGIGGIIGMAVGRIGDIINGEHFAKTTDLPWGLLYTNVNSPSYGLAAQHPAVAYEMFGDFIIFALLLVIYFKVPRAGVTFMSYAIMYGVMRVAVSFLRLDTEVFLGLRMAQLIGIATVPMALGALIYLLRTPPAAERASRGGHRKAPPEDTSDETPPPAAEEPSAG